MNVLYGILIGAVAGIVTLLWDNQDGEVLWLGEVVHSKALTWGLLATSLVILGWALRLYGEDPVIIAVIANVTWVVAAYITSAILPGV